LVPDWLFVEQVNIWHIQSINESIDTCAKVELNELPEWGYFVRIVYYVAISHQNLIMNAFRFLIDLFSHSYGPVLSYYDLRMRLDFNLP
jgi:hypothetical protein